VSLLIVAIAVVVVTASAAIAQSSGPDAAQRAEREGKFAEAAEIWRVVAKANPRDSIAFASLGLDLARQQKYAEAVTAYRKAAALDPKLPGLQLNLGLAEFKQGHFNAASMDPTSVQATALLGMAYYGAARFSEAVEVLKPLTASDPGNTELRNVLAQSCLKSKNYGCAQEQFRAILQQNPDSPAAHLLMGEALDGLQRTEEAVAEFKAASELDPRQPEVHFGLGYLYWELRRFDEAKREFEAELALNPKHAQAQAYLGDIALEGGNLGAAEGLLLKATQNSQKIRIAYLDLGKLYLQRRNYAGAVDAFQHAIKVDPAQSDAHFQLARAYQALGKKSKAQAELAKSRELHTQTDRSLVLKGAAPPSK
jgi:tetratricopeptide (TPR) repeat protein